MDEASIDITDYLINNKISNKDDIYELVNNIRTKVFDKTGGLTVSSGIGPNKMIAKIASNVNKPNGQCMYNFNETNKYESNEKCLKLFMDKLEIRKIPGIGNFAENVLNGLGVYTTNDIIINSVKLFNILTKNTFLSYLKKTNG